MHVLQRATILQTYCSPSCQLKKKPHLAENQVKSRSERRDCQSPEEKDLQEMKDDLAEGLTREESAR